MHAAGFACQECSAEDKTLNVHHTFYVRGRMPWEYPTDSLQCLCEECHEKRTEAVADLKLLIGKLDEHDLQRLSGYAKGLILCDWDSVASESRVRIGSDAESQGLADCYCGDWTKAAAIVHALDQQNTIDHNAAKSATDPANATAGAV
jgi:hypothetical protein